MNNNSSPSIDLRMNLLTFLNSYVDSLYRFDASPEGIVVRNETVGGHNGVGVGMNGTAVGHTGAAVRFNGLVVVRNGAAVGSNGHVVGHNGEGVMSNGLMVGSNGVVVRRKNMQGKPQMKKLVLNKQ